MSLHTRGVDDGKSAAVNDSLISGTETSRFEWWISTSSRNPRANTAPWAAVARRIDTGDKSAGDLLNKWAAEVWLDVTLSIDPRLATGANSP